MTDPIPTSPDASAAPDSAPHRPRKDEKSNTRWVAAGAAMGIGSAALVAALLYAKREKKAAIVPIKPAGPPPESD